MSEGTRKGSDSKNLREGSQRARVWICALGRLSRCLLQASPRSDSRIAGRATATACPLHLQCQSVVLLFWAAWCLHDCPPGTSMCSLVWLFRASQAASLACAIGVRVRGTLDLAGISRYGIPKERMCVPAEEQGLRSAPERGGRRGIFADSHTGNSALWDFLVLPRMREPRCHPGARSPLRCLGSCRGYRLRALRLHTKRYRGRCRPQPCRPRRWNDAFREPARASPEYLTEDAKGGERERIKPENEGGHAHLDRASERINRADSGVCVAPALRRIGCV